MPGADLLGLERAWVDAGRASPAPTRDSEVDELARPFVPLGKLKLCPDEN